jgi:hypothetical protein
MKEESAILSAKEIGFATPRSDEKIYWEGLV